MKVGELILLLSEFDPDEPVLMYGALYREMERKSVVKDVVRGADMDNPNAPCLSPRMGEDVKVTRPTGKPCPQLHEDLQHGEQCPHCHARKIVAMSSDANKDGE